MKKTTISAFFYLLSVVQCLPRSQWSWIGDDIPQPRYSSPMTPSACNNGGRGGEYAFACPHHMMLSDDMELAAKYDNLQEEMLLLLLSKEEFEGEGGGTGNAGGGGGGGGHIMYAPCANACASL